MNPFANVDKFRGYATKDKPKQTHYGHKLTYCGRLIGYFTQVTTDKQKVTCKICKKAC